MNAYSKINDEPLTAEEEYALHELERLLASRIEGARRGKLSTRTIEDIIELNHKSVGL